MKLKRDVVPLIQEQIDIAYRTAYENAAKVAERCDTGNRDQADYVAQDIAAAIRALPIPTVTVIRPETAAIKPETVTPHTIIAGQGLHPVTDEIIDRKRGLSYADGSKLMEGIKKDIAKDSTLSAFAGLR